MKTGLTAIAFCLTFCYVPQPSVAQTVPDTLYGIIKTRNPFALSRQKRERLQRKAEKRCQRYLDKYGNPDLSTWDRADRMVTCTTRLWKSSWFWLPTTTGTMLTRSLRKEWHPKAGVIRKEHTVMNSPIIMMPGKKNAQTITGWPQCASGKKTANHVHYPQGRLKSARFFPRPTGKTNGRRCTERKRETLSLCHFSLGRQYFILKDATNPRTPWPLSNDFPYFCRYEK